MAMDAEKVMTSDMAQGMADRTGLLVGGIRLGTVVIWQHGQSGHEAEAVAGVDAGKFGGVLCAVGGLVAAWVGVVVCG